MFPVKQGEAVLIVMYDASSKQELDSAVEAAAGSGPCKRSSGLLYRRNAGACRSRMERPRQESWRE